jgi:hypothetical protein
MTHNPDPQQRRAGCQAYLLVKYEELGRLHEACWELAHLHDREPESYRRITGSDRLVAYETLHRYWKEIPLTQRRAARQRYLRRN